MSASHAARASGAPARGTDTSRAVAGRAGTGPAGPAGRHPAPTAPGAVKAALRSMVGGFAALFLEVEAGLRPRRHLAPMMSPLLYARLSQVWLRRGVVGRVERVHVVETAPGCCEAVVVVRRDLRWAALAVRLTHGPTGWRVEAVARPEDGPLPPPPYPVPLAEDDSFDTVGRTSDWCQPEGNG